MNRRNHTVRVATDVGGTFTDLVYFETDMATGRQSVRTAKVDTTPPDYAQGVLNVLSKADVTLDEVGFLAHGSTVIINALTERRGVRTGLITTQGFRDVLEIARANRPDFFNLAWRKPAPFVPRHLRRELPGRLNHDGTERQPLDLSTLPGILDDFRQAEVQAIAICLIHAYANPAHEEAVEKAIHKLWPGVSVAASHHITREWREYERTSTAVLCAYVQPIAAHYLGALDQGLRQRGYRAPLYVMQSNCGVDTVAHARQTPIAMVESGPASGFWGAAELGRLIGEPDILALDIGGTTAKCSLIRGGQVSIKTDYWIERDHANAGYPVMVPVVDIVEIGNGGGSIAWIDDYGKMHVGPQSAGAVPGPAAYGRGGVNMTTTDANLVLGRINKHYFCGGEINADTDAVDAALAPLSARLQLPPQEVARGIIRIANDNMVNALKLVSLSCGHDPRDFALVAFGGGGAMHAVALAQELGMRKIIIPRAAPVFSAWGMSMSGLRRDFFANQLCEMHDSTGGRRAQALAADIISRAIAQYGQEGISADQVRIQTFARIRYQNQEHAVEVPLLPGEDVYTHWPAIDERFRDAYASRYTYRLPAPTEVVGFHVVANADIGKLEVAELPRTGAPVQVALKGQRDVDYDLQGIHPAMVYNLALLEPDMCLIGPAIIEDAGTTIVVHPGNHVHIDHYGNVRISPAGKEQA